jgi:hypothetical protein
MSIPLPLRWVSIDPGDFHVGYAEWTAGECTAAYEINPDECADKLEKHERDRTLDDIVYEKFALQQWKAHEMSGNEFLTSQLIGVIKRTAKRGDIGCHGQYNHQHKRIYKMGWFLEMPLKEKRQLPWWGHGTHAKDAWVIGLWFKRQREKA